jgi:L-arabonate dehydrase
MGTASTMASMAEALGMTLPGNAAIPAVDTRRSVHAEQAGSQIVQMIEADLRPSRILTQHAFDNAITVDMAIGGSTNAVVHLVAIARRVGIRLPLQLFDEISRRTPLLADVKPSGTHQMEDFYYAGRPPPRVPPSGEPARPESFRG